MNKQPTPSQQSPMPPSSTSSSKDNEDRPFNPGQATGIISLILAFVGLVPFGLVLSIMSAVQSRKAKMSAMLGVMGIVINTVAALTMIFLYSVFVLSHTGIR